MNRRDYLLLIMLGVFVFLAVGFFQHSPGYMDADYYYAISVRLANGFGFSEPFIWNYLGNPEAIPHPSNTYWLPFTSLLASLGILLLGRADFASARMLFVIIAVMVPLSTASLAYSLTRRRTSAILAGCLAVLSGFYLPYMTITDSFGIYMLLGAAFFGIVSWRFPRESVSGDLKHPLILPCPLRTDLLTAFLLGMISGLMHLTRVDGLIWLVFAILTVIIIGCVRAGIFQLSPRCHLYRVPLREVLRICCPLTIGCLLGYLIPMTPWMIRNLATFRAPFPPDGLRTLWLTDYDEIFIFPAEKLTFSHWWASGLSKILQVRWWALGQNLQTLLAVQGMIFLWPLMVLGWWRLHKDCCVLLGCLFGLIIFSIMVLVFPFPGVRGSYLHSVAAFQPLLWSLATEGLLIFVNWGVARRGWVFNHAYNVFAVGLLFLAVLVSTWVLVQRVVGANFDKPVWDKNVAAYQHFEQCLRRVGAFPDDLVMVNNPPGYFVATGRSSIVIPYGDQQTLLEAAYHYQVKYLILEEHYAKGPLSEVYENPANYAGLLYLAKVDGAHIFRIVSPAGEVP